MENPCNALYRIAEASICLRRYDVGLILYRRFIEACNGESAGAWHGLAICYERVGDLGRAREAYEVALRLHTKHDNARDLLWGGWCALKLNNYRLAYELFRRSVLKDPDYPYAWHSLAVAAMRLGMREEAGKAMSRYRELIQRRPYERRECEGVKVIIEDLETILSMDDPLIRDIKQLIKDLAINAVSNYGGPCGITQFPSSINALNP